MYATSSRRLYAPFYRPRHAHYWLRVAYNGEPCIGYTKAKAVRIYQSLLLAPFMASSGLGSVGDWLTLDTYGIPHDAEISLRPIPRQSVAAITE